MDTQTHSVCWPKAREATIDNVAADKFEILAMVPTRVEFIQGGTSCPATGTKFFRMRLEPHAGSWTGPPSSDVVIVENGIGKVAFVYTPPATKGPTYLAMKLQSTDLTPREFPIAGGKPVIRNDPGLHH